MSRSERPGKDPHEELRAAREVIDTLCRRIERDQKSLDWNKIATQKAILGLENMIDLRTRALSESEARYQTLFDHSPSLAFSVDADGVITRANETARHATRDILEPLVGAPLEELFDPAHRPALKIGGEEASQSINELHLLDGRIVDLLSTPIPGSDERQVHLRDVTSRVEMGRELQHARRLMAIGHLAAGVAHEINNPLAVLQLGLDELIAQLDPAHHAALEELSAHADRIARIVANLHTFAEPRPPERETLSARELLMAAHRIARNSLDQTQVELALEGEDLDLLVDRHQLEQVVVNLLSNASRAMGGHGTIRIEGSRQRKWIELRVLDDGPGIPDALLDQIFTPFVRGERNLGMGLGLSISWGLVQENGGTIRATNRAEGGACFVLNLPAAARRPRRRPPRQSPTSKQLNLPPARILCVEDEAVLKRTLLRLLTLLGHEVVGVDTAEDALAALEQGEFDVVITDLRLPGLSGEALYAKISSSYPELAKRVILMSGFFREESTHPNFLQKPFTSTQLKKALLRVLGPTRETQAERPTTDAPPEA